MMPPAATFGTKASTLAGVARLIRTATVLPSFTFEVARWRVDRTAILSDLACEPWSQKALIVRSSSVAEDRVSASHAGEFLSVPNVQFSVGLEAAVEAVIASYGGHEGDQVLVQPMLTDVAASGVAFSRDPNTQAPYIVINYEDQGDTTTVTSGRGSGLMTFVQWKHADPPQDQRMAAVVALVLELEALFAHDTLDIEFAIDSAGLLFLFQVRPLVVPRHDGLSADDHRAVLQQVANRVSLGMRPDPFIHGRRTVYGIMPDWNPAEIIGVRPRPLALSLYRDLVTDSIWAYQRNNYGYKNLRSHPLLVHFHGLPYIDVRVSFNSFIPSDIDDSLADRLVNYYIERLLDEPELHDKVEFGIIFSCYTPTLPAALKELKANGFRDSDLDVLQQSLRTLTNTIIHHKRGLWRGDIEKLDILEQRYQRLSHSDVDPVGRIYWLLEDCKRYGSLPFAGLARAGFIAVQLMRSLVDIGVLGLTDYNAFLSTLTTVSSRMSHDKRTADKATFLSHYGHLRPGTYDILVPRYDEAPELYFDWTAIDPEPSSRAPQFVLSLDQLREISRLLEEHGLENDVITFFDFIKAGIEGREYSKFVFTRNVSDALSLFRRFGEGMGFSAEDMSYADIGVVLELYLSSADAKSLLEASIANGRRRYAVTRQITLPPIIRSPDDVWSFSVPSSEPNYVTLQAVTAPVSRPDCRDQIAGSIVMIPNADPGFDWLFSFPIAGLITAYGGVNSHMAIRAGEMQLPAVIGAGEVLYERWQRANVLSIDCANRVVMVVR